MTVVCRSILAFIVVYAIVDGAIALVARLALAKMAIGSVVAIGKRVAKVFSLGTFIFCAFHTLTIKAIASELVLADAHVAARHIEASGIFMAFLTTMLTMAFVIISASESITAESFLALTFERAINVDAFGIGMAVVP